MSMATQLAEKTKIQFFIYFQYGLEFADGEGTELTDNVIYEQMYVQCGKYGNDMLLLDFFLII